MVSIFKGGVKIINSRIKKVRIQMEKSNIDYLILGPSANMYYLSGLLPHFDERLQLLILGLEGNKKIVIPEMYRKQLEDEEIEGDIFFWKDEENPVMIVKRILKESKNKKFAIDDNLWFSHIFNLKEIVSLENVYPASMIMKAVRMIKDEDEINNLKKAGQIADKVMEEIKAFIKAGLSEKEIGLEIEMRLKKYSDGLSFEPLVGAGSNGALGHHKPGEYTIKNGDFIIHDFGCKVGGYCSDTTRTFALGNVSDKMKEVYNVVKEAQQKAFEFVKPGVKCEELDAVARDVIESAGYGEFFTHRTGHGVGLDIHEDPYIVKGNDIKVKEGMVFTIEPGIYIPEEFGIRIEDTIFVTNSGANRFNNTTHDLEVL